MRPLRLAGALRAIAVGIVIAALIDPGWHRARRAVDLVAVVATATTDSAQRARVEAAVPPEFAVSPIPTATTDVTVVVGATTLGEVPTHGRVIVLTPPAQSVSLGFTDVDMPPSVTMGTAVVVRVRGRVTHAATTGLRLALTDGAVTLDAVDLELPVRTAAFDTTLVALPTAAGAWPLRVTATTAHATASWDLLTTVRTTPWRVLVYDARASWLSTFVRRTLEADPRFVVAHRVATAPTVARVAGRPPASLAAADAFTAADVVVIGAPDALPDADVRAVARHLRSGGSVLLLVDSLGGHALRTLSGVERWREESGVATMRDGRGLRLTAARVVMPVVDAEDLEPVLSGDGRVGLFRRGVGRGSLWISTARDAWQFRDASRSDFATLWPQRLEDAALAALPPLDAALEHAVLRPGEVTRLVISADRPQAVAVVVDEHRVAIDSVGDRAFVAVTAPQTEGPHEVTVLGARDSVRLPLVVRADARRDRAPDEALLRAWAEATGGTTLPLDALDALGERLRTIGDADGGAARWHPFRSPWWLLVLSTALSGEWFLRRRHGLA